MSSQLYVKCDRCGSEQYIKLAAGCTPEQWTNDLRLEGWWSTADEHDLCQSCGPQPVSLAEDTTCRTCGLAYHGAKGYCDWCGAS